MKFKVVNRNHDRMNSVGPRHSKNSYLDHLDKFADNCMTSGTERDNQSNTFNSLLNIPIRSKKQR